MDLVLLNKANVLLIHRIVQEGRLLYERERGAWQAYQAYGRQRYRAAKPAIAERERRLATWAREVLSNG